MGHELERPGQRDGHQGDERQVDAAADHDQPHRDAQDAHNRDAADEGQEVVGGQEARKEEGEGHQQDQREQKDDALLRQMKDAEHGHSLPPTIRRFTVLGV